MRIFEAEGDDMRDNKLGLMLRLAVIYLAVASAVCVFAVTCTKLAETDAEKKRLDNETKIAMMQMPSLDEAAVYKESGAKRPISTLIHGKLTEEKKIVIVLDAGHGKSSSAMSAEEKKDEGYEYNEQLGAWGEWRHYKSGTFGDECHGSGCTLTAPPNGSCWYPMGNGDRSTEPEINMDNTLAAKKYLEEMGYEVRLTRENNEENPSMTKRVSYCFPNNDTSVEPDAALYVCLHSNAGGGRGTSYISLAGEYMQSFIPDNYIELSNRAGDIINRKVAAASGLGANAPIGGEGYLILFNKCPVPIAYMEIGFFDSSSDLAILRSSSDEIGRAVAEGVNEYITSLE